MLPLILCLLLLGGITAPASAQIYKYIDKNGVVRYTNDLTQVPEDRLPGAKRNAIPEIKSTPPTTPAPQPDRPVPAKPPLEPAKPPLEKMAGPEKPDADLSREAQALEKEYKKLMAEKEQIERDTATYTKRYKTRNRKGVPRKKLKELELQKAEWDKKFIDYQAKKKALELLKEKAAKK